MATVTSTTGYQRFSRPGAVWIAVCVIDGVVLCEMRGAGRKASVATLCDALIRLFYIMTASTSSWIRHS